MGGWEAFEACGGVPHFARAATESTSCLGRLTGRMRRLQWFLLCPLCCQPTCCVPPIVMSLHQVPGLASGDGGARMQSAVVVLSDHRQAEAQAASLLEGDVLAGRGKM